MKKYLFFATALVALASCSEESLVTKGTEPPTNSESKAITFNSSSVAITRGESTGAAAATKLNNNFVVEGVKWDGSGTQEVVYDHYNVNWVTSSAYSSTSNTHGWEYVGQAKHAYGPAGAQAIKYWDYAKSQYDFIAYSVGTATPNYTSTYDAAKVQISEINLSKLNGVKDGDGKITDGAFTIKGTADNLAKIYIADLATAYRDLIGESDYNKVVQFKFRPLSTKVRIALYETIPGYSVKDVVFYTSASTAATDGKAHLYTTGDVDVFNTEGTYIVYYPTTGSSNKNKEDYNKPHLAFKSVGTGGTSQTSMFGALDNTNTGANKEVEEAAGKIYLGRTSNAATYAGDYASNHYTIVIPNEAGSVLNLKVNYKLVATDGSGEVISVTGATAIVPAQYAQWKPGFAYTYLFKISDNTNGATNPSLGPAGLYPITFDAVVLDDETSGIQESITTVSTTSITTFGVKGGKYTYNKNEYQSGTTIYVTCVTSDGSVFNPNLGGNTHIYRVTSANESVYPITEASVAESQLHPSGNKITVTHECCGYNSAATVTSVPAEDGTTKTINAIKFTPTTDANKTFAIRYTVNTPVVATYTSEVLTQGTSLEGYYRDTYTACGESATAVDGTQYYKKVQYVEVTGISTGALVENYYTEDGGVYTQCTSGEIYDSSKTYYRAVSDYYEVVTGLSAGDSVVGYYTKNSEKTPCESSEVANGVTTYYLPATYSTNPSYAYKIIRVKP